MALSQSGNRGTKATYENVFEPQPKSQKSNLQAVQSTPRSSVMLAQPVPAPNGLPLRFIDETALRQPSNMELRRVIRSHARRDTDLKRKRLNAALRSNLKNPRTILGKSDVSPSIETPVVYNQMASISPGSSDSGGFTGHQVHKGDGGLLTPARSINLDDCLEGGDATHRDSVLHCMSERHSVSYFQHLDVRSDLVGGSWRHDPFDIHSMLHNSRMPLLLSYYNEVVDTVWVCRKSLWAFQTSTPALLHATMLYTASHVKFLSGSAEFEKDILHHKGETMRLINASLDNHADRISDQIIAALSSLILFEETYGSGQVASVHRDGLKRLLQLRYSKPQVEVHRLVQHLLVHPQVDPEEPNVSVASSEETGHAGRLTNLSRSLVRNRVQGTALGHGVTSVYMWLTSTPRRDKVTVLGADYRTIRNNVEVYIASFDTHGERPVPTSAWLISSMIYLHIIIITPTDASRMPRSEAELVSQLKMAMAKVLSGPDGFSYPCSMRLWVMMMGGLHSRWDDALWVKRAALEDLDDMDTEAKVLLRDVDWLS